MELPKRCTLSVALLALVACGPGESGSRGDNDYTERMATEHADDAPVASSMLEPPTEPTQAQVVTYATVEGQPVKGYLAQPAGAEGPLPGLVVIHEWWGLNDNIKQTAERLAAEGYATLAVDLYDGKVAEVPKEAMQLSQGLMKTPEPAEKNLVAAYEYLEQAVGSPRIGVIGWCMGGRWSLKTALLLPEQIDASVIYYGNLTDDEAQLATLNMPILGLFGASDPIVKVESVRKFRTTMRRLNKSASVHVYPDANHGFANPSGQAYDAVAAEDAWQRTVAFLQENLASEQPL